LRKAATETVRNFASSDMETLVYSITVCWSQSWTSESDRLFACVPTGVPSTRVH